MDSKPVVIVERAFRDPRQTLERLGVFVTLSLLLVLAARQGLPTGWLSNSFTTDLDLHEVARTARHYAENPIQSPYKDQFWEVGQRSRQLSQWLSEADSLHRQSEARRQLLATSEAVSQQLFPFLQRPPQHPRTRSPLADLRKSYEPGSRGIVIPVEGGERSIRFAGHLIVSLRNVLGCQLPIQIAYAGEDDLPQDDRDTIEALNGVENIEFLDVTAVFDDATLKLRESGWAIKPFAVLASRFEEVILMDADAVFLQDPEILLTQKAYLDKGALLFHDRLLWQNAYQERHQWWRDQIKEPSIEMLKSLVWTQNYAEEADPGVIVVDKSRVNVFVGLLHVAWQNTYAVREEVTYKLTHGDKESWWLGLELAGSTYEFEAHYGSILGWAESSDEGSSDRVCSFVVAHVDQEDRLVWYNGSLLKNKTKDADEYEIPDSWMVDGKWAKGRTKKDMSCMMENTAVKLTERESRVLRDSVDGAKRVDAVLRKQRKLN
ncbi:hypothetical protein G7046_g8891 [Stylonectria norvegica]|nr:hypothetical protein G7046_g8891 [Stylonectria norvegica]